MVNFIGFPFRLMTHDVGVDAGGLLLHVLRLETKSLSVPVLAKLHARSYKAWFLSGQVLCFQELFHVFGR